MNQIETFSQVCKTWFLSSLAFIQSLAQFPAYQDFDVTFSNGGYSTTAGETEIDFISLFRSIHQQLFNSPEFDALVQLISTTPEPSNAFF